MSVKYVILLHVVLVSTCLSLPLLRFDPLKLLYTPHVITSLLVQEPGPFNEDPLPTISPQVITRDDSKNEIPRVGAPQRLSREAREEVEDRVPTINAEPGVGVGGSSRTGVGVGVNVPPFVNVKVATSGHGTSGRLLPLSPDLGSVLPDVGVGSLIPGVKRGGPLDLNINIPSIFRLKLNRDEDGSRRLGIGVLPLLNGPGLVSVGVDTRHNSDDEDEK